MSESKQDKIERQIEEINEYLSANAHYVPLIHKICCVEGKPKYEAAPNLLKALKNILSRQYCEGHPYYQGSDLGAFVKEAQAAIVKAEGK